MHIIKHFLTITKHKNRVMKYCFKCGLYRQGLLHDLSKYSFVEFFNGTKFYLGTKSPHHQERIIKGYSDAWMHHKGRNKHHMEYWVDVSPITHNYEPVDVPNRYVAESICDRLAATEIYNKKKFDRFGALDYFHHEGNHLPLSLKTKDRIEYLLTMYAAMGRKYTFRYIKKYMRNNKTDIPMEESFNERTKNQRNL